jgi:CRISPR-associated endonuclease/helicase Cas3
MDADERFREAFRALTGNGPFPWQEALFERFVAGDFESCRTCTLPTGLGKTAIIALWLIALSRQPTLVPRRLAYVVNRRTVVDQTTDGVEKYRKRLIHPEAPPEMVELRECLTRLCAFTPDQLPAISTDGRGNWSPLAISTLRGQFADNQEWSLDPARPAVICGTVDMLGSRLLFSAYRIGFKSRPHHAGLLGHDTLLIHDEAHLEPAFQRLLKQIVAEQCSPRTGDSDKSRRLKVIELSATTRTADEQTAPPFALTEEERNPPEEVPPVRLRTVGRGQEFVLDGGHYPEALAWAESLVQSELKNRKPRRSSVAPHEIRS